MIEARYNYDEDLLGGRVGFIASSYTLFRDRGRDVTRLSLGVDWEKQVILDWGLALTAFAEARGDLFIVSEDPALGSDTAPADGADGRRGALSPWSRTRPTA